MSAEDSIGGQGSSSELPEDPNPELVTDSEYSDASTNRSDHNTDSELSEASVESDENSDSESSDDENANQRYWYSKSRFKWAKSPPTSSRTRAHNIVSHLPGVTGEARVNKPTEPVDAWLLMIDETMIDQVVQYTNIKITNMLKDYGENAMKCQFTSYVDKTEMKALLGLLILSGVFKSNHEDVELLFATDGTGRDIFRATMSLKRFLFLLAALRFDDLTTRDERRAVDRLAPISEFFNELLVNCQSNYCCGEYLTVDEMLVSFRGRCAFRRYMANKPAKYGLKIFCLCDARTHYLYNAFIDCGPMQVPNPRRLMVPTLTVMALIEPVANTNRNITGDNYFSSVELVNELRSKGLTYVGTLRANKREIPKEFLPNRQREVLSSEFGFTGTTTLVSYVPKKSKAVILISSMHHEKSLLPREDKKPEIIDFYNLTKPGVDSLDQKAANYDVGRRSKRWPLTLFYRCVVIACTNSFVIFTTANPDTTITRRDFVISVGKSLIQDHMVRRLDAKIPRELRSTIQRVRGVQEELNRHPQAQPRPGTPKRGRCHICPRKVDKKYTVRCGKCHNTVCPQHADQSVVCKHCFP